MAVKRNVREEGVVVAKEFKKATNEFKDATGRTVPPQPDRWFVSVVSSDNFSQEMGFENPAIKDFKIDEPTWNKIKYLSPVKVTLEVTEYGVKPVKNELGFNELALMERQQKPT